MELIMKTGAAAVLRLNPLDDVLIARRPLLPDEVLEQEGVAVRQPVPAGHKIASRRVDAGQPVRRYGQIIGFASELIEAGDHVILFVVDKKYIRDVEKLFHVGLSFF